MSSHTTPKPNRRDFLAQALGLGALLSRPARGLAQERLPTRTIPGTGEAIPVIGFGSSKPVIESRGRARSPSRTSSGRCSSTGARSSIRHRVRKRSIGSSASYSSVPK